MWEGAGARLTAPPMIAHFDRMLQHNTSVLGARALKAGKKAHIAHAAMISIHTLCCGMPILAVMLAALSGAAAGTSLLVVVSRQVHTALHAHEFWILGLSATLVTLGAVFEVLALRAGLRRRFSPLFAVSCACFVFNLAILVVHRGI